MFRMLSAGVAFLILSCFGTMSMAADPYPTKPIQIIVGFTPGGGSDLVARLLAPGLSAEFGVPVVVENKVGAGGVIAADIVAKSKPDGHTLLLASPGAFTIAVSLRKLPYDPAKDFTTIAQLDSYPNILVVNTQSGINSFADLVRKAKENPGKLNYASTGNGATPHLAFAHLNMITGIDTRHIPYKGNPPAIADLLGGQVSLFIGDPLPLMPHIESGKLKALAVTTKDRFRLLPNIPSMAEVGVAGYDVPFWHALVGPRDMPPEVVAKLEAALRKIMVRKEFVTAIENAAMAVELVGGAQLSRRMAEERSRWEKVIKANNIKE
ncbi:MAG: tripartite tricarboxylate transporter substrate binding protein [Burkholderiaceae bacterium]|nr:tripartite tricarboxylate transporter substrate binding protein [Burkholderiaceae bacterium]MDO9088703.1 tripartite tricarboxylate transporter substrate binding protein [Burkholderiaceae bacterium]